MFVDGWCNDLNMRCTSDRTTCTLDINKLHRTYGALVKSVVISCSSTCQAGFYWFWRGYFNLKVKTVVFQILAIPCLWIKLIVENECIVVNPYPLEVLSLTIPSCLPLCLIILWKWDRTSEVFLICQLVEQCDGDFSCEGPCKAGCHHSSLAWGRHTPRHGCFHNHHLYQGTQEFTRAWARMERV